MKNILYITLALLLLISCKRNVNPVEGGADVAMEIEGVVNDVASAATATTKLNATTFEDGDSISVYVVKYIAGNPPDLGASDVSTYIKNQLFKRDDGLFKSYNGTDFNHQYFPKDGSAVDIYSFYPYDAAIPADYTAYQFAVQTDQSTPKKYFKSDFLMTKRANVAPTAVPNKLVFNHLLSRVVVNARTVDFLDQAKVKSLKLINTNTKVVINLRAYNSTSQIAGSVVSTSTPKSIDATEESLTTRDYDKTFSVIIPPQMWDNGASVMELILTNTDKHTLKLSEAFTLVSGMEHIVNIDVNFGAQYAITDSVSVVPWGTSTANAAAEQKSDNPFHVLLTNIGGNQVSSITKVKVGVNNNRTFELNLTKFSGQVVQDLYFEFRGVGNRPGDYPFSITSFEMLNSSGFSVGGKVVVDPVIVVTKPSLIDLVYDMNAKTITKTTI